MASRRFTNLALVINPEDQSLSDLAYRQIEELIVTNQLAPGTPISESQLSALLDIGRTPIREALQRLSREHLVTILPKRGVFITDVNAQKQLRVLETRRELERLICKKAAKRANAEDKKEFERLAKEFRLAARDKNNTLFLKIDKELNDFTVIAARNEFAAAAMSSLHGMSRRFWFGHLQQHTDLVESANLHAILAEEIAQGKEKQAGIALDKLLDYIEECTRNTFFAEN